MGGAQSAEINTQPSILSYAGKLLHYDDHNDRDEDHDDHDDDHDDDHGDHDDGTQSANVNTRV